jgi:hypothetical protein
VHTLVFTPDYADHSVLDWKDQERSSNNEKDTVSPDNYARADSSIIIDYDSSFGSIATLWSQVSDEGRHEIRSPVEVRASN